MRLNERFWTATTMRLLDFLSAVEDHKTLRQLTVAQLLAFMKYTSLLKRDIDLPQPVDEFSGQAPYVLPPSVAEFLSEAVGILLEDVSTIWLILKDAIWVLPDVLQRQEEEEAFRLYGWKRGLSALLCSSPMKAHIAEDDD
jgi:hypothetical protein